MKSIILVTLFLFVTLSEDLKLNKEKDSKTEIYKGNATNLQSDVNTVGLKKKEKNTVTDGVDGGIVFSYQGELLYDEIVKSNKNIEQENKNIELDKKCNEGLHHSGRSNNLQSLDI